MYLFAFFKEYCIAYWISCHVSHRRISVPVLLIKVMKELFENIVYLQLLEVVIEYILVAACIRKALIELLEAVKVHSNLSLIIEVLIGEYNCPVNRSIFKSAFFHMVINIIEMSLVLELRIIELMHLRTNLMCELFSLSGNGA